MSKYRAWLLLVATTLFWAGNYVFGKFVIIEMTPLWITFSRWLLALLLLIPIACFLEKPKWKMVKKAWIPLISMGVLGSVGYNLVLYSALAYTSPTNAALVSALNPAVIVLFSVFLLHERITWLQTSGIVLSLIGAFVLITQGNFGQLLQHEYNKGDVFMLGAVVIWTLYSIIGRRLISVPPITATAVSAVFATLLLAPFAIAQGIDVTKISPLTMTGILYIAIFPSVFSFIFWNMSIRAIGISQAGIFLNLIPVFTAIISWILGERTTGTQVLGGSLVFLGVYLTSGMLNHRFAVLFSKHK
ncbi:Permease of the drug/metabolite transporter (DMT) superfamily [Desulfosporosinus sp. I2]|uniref:DMT family transporter n=1 Tax=Desulfosporosinus sp. I2 TaxID=1617025 RepID=UPI0005EF3AB7|nr:DMT family transporter [Desulfosporosinus sp. I2]KJR47134.1 Permease of the drug/metabolite transporter (DMT) superfamily [Desulfosporosinus sp. I2]